MRTVAVIGLGAMGSALTTRLLSVGNDVIVWNRTSAKLAPMLDLGAVSADSPAGAARRADVVITMVSDPSALIAVTEGPEGIAGGATAGTTVIQMSTVDVAAVKRLEAALPSRSELLDAPVLGSVSEAEEGSLQVFVGGSDRSVERWRPLLASLGDVHHLGDLGAGTAAKLVANATLFAVLAALGESLALAGVLGLSGPATFEILATTPLAMQADRRREALERGEFPLRFPLRLARKDADLISAIRVDAPLLEAARGWLSAADADASGVERDYSTLLEYIPRRSREKRDRGTGADLPR